MASSPIPTDNPDRTTAGRDDFLSQVPTSLTQSLHDTLITNLSSIFLDFENITKNILESECGNLPESDGSPDFECWHRMTGSTTDVEYLGIDFQAVLFNNQDLGRPDQTFVNAFNASIDYMKDNATRAMRFVETIPASMRINMDHCDLPLAELLLPSPNVLPTTTSIAPATVVVIATSTLLTTIPTTTSSIVSPTNTVESSDNGSRQTGFNATLLLLSAILLHLNLTH